MEDNSFLFPDTSTPTSIFDTTTDPSNSAGTSSAWDFLGKTLNQGLNFVLQQDQMKTDAAMAQHQTAYPAQAAPAGYKYVVDPTTGQYSLQATTPAAGSAGTSNTTLILLAVAAVAVVLMLERR